MAQDVLQALRSFRQYLSEENKRMAEEERQQNVNIAAQEIANRFKKIGDSASESDIRSLTFTTISDAAKAGVLPQVQGMISSFSQDAIKTAEGKSEEQFAIGLSGDQSLRGAGSNAIERMNAKEQWEDSQVRYQETSSINKEGAEEVYLAKLDEHTLQVKEKTLVKKGPTLKERMNEYAKKESLQLRFSRGSASESIPKPSGWLPGGGRVFMLHGKPVIWDSSMGTYVQYDERIHGTMSNSPNAELSAEKLIQTQLWQQYEKTKGTIEDRAATELRQKAPTGALMQYLDKNNNFTKGTSPLEILKSKSAEWGIDVTPYLQMEDIANAAYNKWNEYSKSILYDERLREVGLSNSSYDMINQGMEQVIESDSPEGSGLRKALWETDYANNIFQDPSKLISRNITKTWWKNLLKEQKIKYIISVSKKGYIIEAEEEPVKKKQKRK